ncbi:hypothetical protein COOONC_21128 [Cooperia oncophora]
MPFGDPPDYVHLRTNESQMQLITMGEQPETPSGSPCFNAPSTREEPATVVVFRFRFQFSIKLSTSSLTISH